MFLTSWNVCIPIYVTIWPGQNHVGEEVATEITPKFAEGVV